MSADESSKRPTHRLYAVTRTKDTDKGLWREIGAAWPHGDGEGFSLKLDCLPLNGADLVLRKVKVAEETEVKDAA